MKTLLYEWNTIRPFQAKGDKITIRANSRKIQGSRNESENRQKSQYDSFDQMKIPHLKMKDKNSIKPLGYVASK